ncbi:MAG: LysM peptidoglycan-binding domain-containing protein [Actinomycetota bacterium]
MVALLKPTTCSAPLTVVRSVPGCDEFEGGGRSGGGAAVTARPEASRAPLRLVDSPPREPLIGGVPVAGIAVAVAVVFGLLFAVRLVQGSPPAVDEVGQVSDPRVSAPALPGPGDHIHVARSGDSLWSIAVGLAPDADPRPIVDALAEANGGTALRVGQQVVIPAEVIAEHGG